MGNGNGLFHGVLWNPQLPQALVTSKIDLEIVSIIALIVRKILINTSPSNVPDVHSRIYKGAQIKTCICPWKYIEIYITVIYIVIITI